MIPGLERCTSFLDPVEKIKLVLDEPALLPCSTLFFPFILQTTLQNEMLQPQTSYSPGEKRRGGRDRMVGSHALNEEEQDTVSLTTKRK